MKFHPAPYVSCLLLALTCMLFSAQGAFAQAQPQEHSITFRAYLWSEPEGRVVALPSRSGGPEAGLGEYIPLEMGFINKDGGLTEFEMTSGSFSQTQDYRGLSPLVFAVEQPGSTADAPAYRKVGQVALPEGVEEAILFFFPQGNVVNGHYNVSLLPSGPNDIPAGQALVVNLTGAPIAVKLGNQQIALQPEGMQQVGISGLEQNRLPVMMAAQSNEEWRLRLRRKLAVTDNSALLILFHQDEGVYRIENIRLQR